MKTITSKDLPLLKEKEFSVLFFHAKGCQHCENAKPVFQKFSEAYPNILFLSIEFQDAREYYEKFAEEIPLVVYEPLLENDQPILDEKGNQITKAVAQFNEDGTPKLVKKYAFPTFYVHHTEAAKPDNEFGFIGGFDGLNVAEAQAVLNQLNEILMAKLAHQNTLANENASINQSGAV